MTKASADSMTLFVAALGLCTTIAAYFVAGSTGAYGTGTGAVLGLANFMLLRTIVSRIVDGGLAHKGPVLALLFFKMGALMALVYLVIAQRWVEPIAFLVGLSTLVVGLIASSLFLARPAASEPLHGSES